jgi:hypothetical protein
MQHSFIFCCDNCGDEIEIPANFGDQYDAGKCKECKNGTYRKSGESYDQEFIDEERYNEQQDREYEERHRYDDRY